MKTLRAWGGAAALFEALAYTIGFAAMLTVLSPGDTSGWDAVRKLSFMLEKKPLFQHWMLLLYILGGTGIAVLSVALHERMRTLAPEMMPVTTAVGLIWAGLVLASGMIFNVGLDTVASLHASDPQRAATAWVAIGAVQEGLGGGIEFVGGLWVLLVSLASWRTRTLPRALDALGLLIGVAGLLSTVPGLGDLSMIFGLAQIPWFAWLGVWMLRQKA